MCVTVHHLYPFIYCWRIIWCNNLAIEDSMDIQVPGLYADFNSLKRFCMKEFPSLYDITPSVSSGPLRNLNPPPKPWPFPTCLLYPYIRNYFSSCSLTGLTVQYKWLLSSYSENLYSYLQPPAFSNQLVCQ